jgi:hypothetical protein
MTWTIEIFRTQTGSPQQIVEASMGAFEARITGRGQGTHAIPLPNSGLTSGTIRELSKGNEYTIVQRWGDHIAYAGVIRRAQYLRSTRTLLIASAELRAAYMDDRMLYGVFSYDPAGTVLAVSNKSRSGAARAVIAKAMDSASFWELPIDLPADGVGTFSASWKHAERLTWEDHLSQIEADGCEIYFRPYKDGSGFLRWQTEVATRITIGSATTLSVSDEDTKLEDVTLTKDYAREMTGILGFGKGGTSAEAYGYSPGDGAASISVRDVWLNFPDLEGGRLAAAVEALDELADPVEQWSFGLHVYPAGPAFAAIGKRLDLAISGDPFITDGTHPMRVIALRGDMSTKVTAEVQRAS